MFGLADHTHCPIGIDIGTHSVKLLQFRRRQGQLALQAAGSAEVGCSPGADAITRAKHERDAIARVLGSGRFDGRWCVTTLPPRSIYAKSIRLPPMPEADMAQAIRWEAGDRLGFDLSQGQLAFFKAGEVRRGTEVREELLLFAATADSLNPHSPPGRRTRPPGRAGPDHRRHRHRRWGHPPGHGPGRPDGLLQTY